MTDQQITVQITETIKYTKTYEVSDLEEMLGTNLADMTPEEIASYVKGEEKIEEDMQRYGDVYDARWTVVPGRVYPQEVKPIALAVDDDCDVQVMVLQSMDEVYTVLRENYAQDEDVADDVLIDHLQSQGTLVYIGS